MYIEDRLNSIEAKLDFLIKSGNAIPADESGIAGAGAEPAVAQQVNQAIAAATPAAPAKPRGRGRPPKVETKATPPAQSPAAPVAPQPDPFALVSDEPKQPTAKARTLTEVKAAMVVYQAQNSQEAALKLLKDTTGAETLAALAKADPSTFSKLFKTAIPADKFAWDDVRPVLVAAEARKKDAGVEVMQRFGAKNAKDLPEDQYVEVILAAHVAGR